METLQTGKNQVKVIRFESVRGIRKRAPPTATALLQKIVGLHIAERVTITWVIVKW